MQPSDERDSFVFDRAKGLYLPEQHCDKPSDSDWKSPTSYREMLLVEVKRDLLLTGLSALTLLLLVFTVVYAKRQWLEANRSSNAAEIAANAAASAAETAKSTLQEMQNGSTAADTHTLAIQAKTQAEKTSELAKEEIRQANATNQLALETGRTANAAIVANQATAAARRPWIGLDGSLSVVNVPAPRTLGRFTFDIKLKNFGLSTAKDVFPAVRWTSSRDAIPRQMDLACSTAVHWATEMKAGTMVFPGNDMVPTLSSVEPGQIDPPLSRSGGLYAAVCIAYRDLDGALHKTELCQQKVGDDQFNPCGFQSAD